MTRAALYARLSRDRSGEETATARQLQDCVPSRPREAGRSSSTDGSGNVDLVARAPDHAADGRREVAQPVAWLRGGDPLRRAPAPRSRSGAGPRRVASHRNRDRGVGDPAVDLRGEVEADEVPVPEPPVVRQPVEHRVVDRDAQHLAERHRAERGVVVDVAARGAVLADHRVRDPVELQHVDADPGPRQCMDAPPDEVSGQAG
jgi:hypothetical protein